MRLFELTGALAGAGRPVRSVAELMFDPACRRGWGSLYQALESGEVIVEQARDVLARWVRPAGPGGPAMFAIDASKYPRPGTRHVPDVGMQYDAALDRHGHPRPAVPGWSFQWVAQVGLDGDVAAGGSEAEPAGSWVMPMDVRRVPTAGNASEIAADQILDLLGRLEAIGAPDERVRVAPLFLLDVGYCPIYLTQRLAGERVQLLVRLRSDRVFFGVTPPRVAGKGGAPKKHGPRVALDEPDTWGEPDAQLRIARPDGGRLTVQAWHRKHPEPRARQVGRDRHRRGHADPSRADPPQRARPGLVAVVVRP